MENITQEEIKKALDTLDGLSGENRENHNTEDDDVNDLIKSLHSDFDAKIKSIGAVNQFLIQQNETLVEQNSSLSETNETILKSLDSVLSHVEKMSETIEDMASSPINQLNTTLKKSIAVEKFGGEADEKPVLSLTRDKRKILGMLEKSLSTEEGQRRLSNVVGLIENGFVGQENFTYIRKSIENEIGVNNQITL
jgi:chromosome segregation ATPase